MSFLLLFPLLLSAYSSDLQNARKLQVEGRYAEAETLYRQMLASGDYLPRDEAKIYNNLGSVLFEAGHPAEAEPFVRRAIQSWEKDSDSADVLKLGAAYNNLGAIQRAKGNPREAEASYRKAMEILRDANDVESLAPVLSNLGSLYAGDRARYAEAEALQREALLIRESSDRQDPQLGNSYSALAQLLQSTGRYAEAESMHVQALQIHEATLPARHPQLARDRANLALLYRTTNRLAEAEAMYLRSLVDFEQSVGKKHPDYATTLNNIAKIRATVGDRKTAVSLYRQAIAIWEEALGADHPNVAAGLSNLADLLRVEHRYEQAAQLFRRVIAIDEAKLGDAHPHTADAYGNLGIVCYLRKNFAEAQAYLEKAWELKTRIFGPTSVEAAQARADVAELYRVTRREPQAIVAFREAMSVLEHAWHKDDIRFLRILHNYEAALRSQQEFAEAERVGVWSTRIRVRQTLLAKAGPH